MADWSFVARRGEDLCGRAGTNVFVSRPDGQRFMLCMAQANNQAVFMYVYFLNDIALAQPKLSKIDERD